MTGATALAGIRSDGSDVTGRPFAETPWFTPASEEPDAVRKAFAAVLRGEDTRTEMLLHLPIGDRYFDPLLGLVRKLLRR